MTRDEAVSRIRNYLGFNTRLDSNVIIDALKDAQEQLEHAAELPWFLLTEVSSIPTVAGESRTELPSDFLREYEEEALYRYDSSTGEWVVIEKRDIDTLRTSYVDISDGWGVPKFYALDNRYFRLYPIPDDAYTLKLVYYAKDTALDSNIENDWLKHAPLLLIGTAGVLVASMLRDDRAVKTFTDMATMAFSQLQSDSVAREVANRRYIMGGED